MKILLPIICLTVLISTKTPAFGQNNTIYKSKADSVVAVKNYLSTIKFCTEAINSKTTNKNGLIAMYMLRGSTEGNLGEYTKAIGDFTSTISINPQFWQAYLKRGITYEHTKNYQLAIDDYKRSAQYLQDNKKGLTILYDDIAVNEEKLKHSEKAIEADSTALAITPQFVLAYQHRAYSYAVAGKYQLAINDLSSAIFGYQDNPKILSVLLQRRADMKKLLKNLREAITDYSQAIKFDASNKHAYWGRAACYYKNGDYQLADDDYSKAIIYFKGDNISLSRLYDDRAQMEMGLQQLDKAIKDDSLSIMLDPQYGIAYLNRGNARTQNGDYALGDMDFKKAMDHYQNNNKALAQLYTDIAHNEYFLNEYQNDLNDCTSAIKCNPSYYSPYMERGRAYLKLMKKDAAINDFKQVLVLDTTRQTSDYAFALYYTGDGDNAVKVMQNTFINTTNTYQLMIDYYNMACLLSLMNKAGEANIYLKKCIGGGYPKRYVITDADFDNIRNTAEYKSIINGNVN